jgi:hypothetical protein
MLALWRTFNPVLSPNSVEKPFRLRTEEESRTSGHSFFPVSLISSGLSVLGSIWMYTLSH